MVISLSADRDMMNVAGIEARPSAVIADFGRKQNQRRGGQKGTPCR